MCASPAKTAIRFDSHGAPRELELRDGRIALGEVTDGCVIVVK